MSRIDPASIVTIFFVPSRILVYGVTGSGKSTLASEIADRTGQPLYLVDELTWLPGWISVPDEEQRRRVEAICSGDRWVLDTAYGKWLDAPMSRVELIVGLDYPRWVSLSRLVRRSLARTLTRRTVCNGNVETFRKLLSSDSIILWHFRSFQRKRTRIRAWESDAAAPRVVRLNTPRMTRRWLADLDHRKSATTVI
jgi:adenylate kinase family enzyme